MKRWQTVAGVVAFLVAPAVGKAAVSPRVHTEAAAKRIASAEWREWQRHDGHARSYALRCTFTHVHGPKGPRRTGRPETCTFRVYRTRDHHQRLAVLTLAVSVAARVPAGLGEDGAGAVTYSPRRSLLLDALP